MHPDRSDCVRDDLADSAEYLRNALSRCYLLGLSITSLSGAEAGGGALLFLF